jgi:hypothetical protein
MTIGTSDITPRAPGAEPAVRIRADHSVVRKLGQWTTARHFDVRSSRGNILLDLRSPRLRAGTVEIWLDLDSAVLRLLVPDGADVDDSRARRHGDCRIRDRAGTGAPGGRRILLGGQLRTSEVRVQRGALPVRARRSPRNLAGALRARRDDLLAAIDGSAR